MNGCGRTRRSDSTVTAPSFIASRSADCVFGVARLISSARTMLAKIGPGVELETIGRRVEDRDAEHVGRERVARELDAPEVEREAAAERARERRLSDARDVLDQDVAAGQQRRQEQIHGAGLAPVGERDVFAELRERGGGRKRVGHRESRPSSTARGLGPRAPAFLDGRTQLPLPVERKDQDPVVADDDRGVAHAGREDGTRGQDEVAGVVARAAELPDRPPRPDVAPAGVERNGAHATRPSP